MKEIKLKSNGGGSLFESNTSKCGIVFYLELFGVYVVHYSNRWYKSSVDNHIELLGDTNSRDNNKLIKSGLKTMSDVNEFCRIYKIEIAKINIVTHPLAHGLPDCRSLK